MLCPWWGRFSHIWDDSRGFVQRRTQGSDHPNTLLPQWFPGECQTWRKVACLVCSLLWHWHLACEVRVCWTKPWMCYPSPLLFGCGSAVEARDQKGTWCGFVLWEPPKHLFLLQSNSHLSTGVSCMLSSTRPVPATVGDTGAALS